MVGRVVAVSAGSSVTVSWNHDESGPPTEFEIERQVDGGGYAAAGTTPYVAGQTSYSVIDEGGVPGVQYRVRANNAAGSSAWVESNVPTFPPNPVTNLIASV